MELRERFAEHGWVILRGAVPLARVRELEAALDALYARWPQTAPGEVWEVPGISRADVRLEAHARAPSLAAQIAEALGCERLQLLQDTALVKPARIGGPVLWHQDHTYTGYLEPARVISARLALTPCHAGNGGMEVIDRSHLWGPVTEVKALSESNVGDALGGRAAAFARDVVPLELEPGDVSLHHCLTLHRSGPNTSGEARKTLIGRFFDGACRLRPDALPEAARAHFPLRADGGLDERAFPLVFAR